MPQMERWTLYGESFWPLLEAIEDDFRREEWPSHMMVAEGLGRVCG